VKAATALPAEESALDHAQQAAIAATVSIRATCMPRWMTDGPAVVTSTE
jgi:hypothetical protein